jgi:niacin transporter
MKKNSVFQITAAGLLIAVGVLIPMISPLKLIIEPASFTLASHVAIFIAMFISPGMAATVAVGVTAGFFLGGFAPVIVLRAASHIVFAVAGAIYLKTAGQGGISAVALRIFSFCIGLLHAVSELFVVSVFYFGGSLREDFYRQGFIISVLLGVGVGTVIHSMVDFEIAHVVRLALRKYIPAKKA